MALLLTTRVLYNPNTLSNELNGLFHSPLTRIELNDIYVCKLSFYEKKSLSLLTRDANYRIAKMTATCQLNGIDQTKSPTFWQDGFLKECMWRYFTEL